MGGGWVKDLHKKGNHRGGGGKVQSPHPEFSEFCKIPMHAVCAISSDRTVGDGVVEITEERWCFQYKC